VAEHSRNSEARLYQPTDWEHAMRCYDQRKEDSMLFYIKRFGETHPDNFSCNRFWGRYYQREKMFDSALVYFQRAAEVYPDDFAVHFRIVQMADEIFMETQDPDAYLLANEHAAEVIRLVPNDPKLRNLLAPYLNR
jgi:hypothetical protein